MSKGSGMIHPNMATMLGVLFLNDSLLLLPRSIILLLIHLLIILVITNDALVTINIWRKMVQTAVDGETSTNGALIALASGLLGSKEISSLDCSEAEHLQLCLDAVIQGLAKSIVWDGERATCLIEVLATKI
ncbi:hypothetical protein M9H77_03508 [Catharanthus roseus]|uniref:Uncharacterized protein n=1 Tax=Catharanthus roseus TaxID=4058 RepID=A0ACC0CBH9_CATRO|nr:hypothetical protein M9H77_03508 [Catharanthus roseus]